MQLSDDFALLWLASGQDFQNTMCPAVPYFLNFESICAEYPIHRVLPYNLHLLSNSSPAKTWLSTGKLSLPHRSTIQRTSISITQNRGKYGVIHAKIVSSTSIDNPKSLDFDYSKSRQVRCYTKSRQVRCYTYKLLKRTCLPFTGHIFTLRQ